MRLKIKKNMYPRDLSDPRPAKVMYLMYFIISVESEAGKRRFWGLFHQSKAEEIRRL